jgi:hypothetical protein
VHALPHGRIWERKDAMLSLGYHRLTVLSRAFIQSGGWQGAS